MSVHGGPAKWWTSSTKAGKEHVIKRGIVQSNLIINLDASSNDSYSGTGTTWTNLANTSSNGTIQNSPTFSNEAFVFDGIDDAVALTPDFFVQNSAKPFSISMWFKTTQTSGGTLFGQQNTNTPSSAGGWVPVIYLRVDGKIRFEPFWTGNSGAIVLSSAALNNNRWHNAVGTFSSGTAKLYINGVYQNQLTGLSQVTYANPHYYFVGAGYSAGRALGSHFFSGSISRFAFYTKELSNVEITRNFNALRGRFGI